MAIVEETTATRDASLLLRKRRCPDCGNYLFLEPVYGEGYWWNCLICGWNRPADEIGRRAPLQTR